MRKRIVFRFACRVCPRRGAYRLAGLNVGAGLAHRGDDASSETRWRPSSRGASEATPASPLAADLRGRPMAPRSHKASSAFCSCSLISR